MVTTTLIVRITGSCIFTVKMFKNVVFVFLVDLITILMKTENIYGPKLYLI